MRVIDMHCDTIYEILEAKKRGEVINLRKNQLMVDLEKMKQGGYSIQNFALFIEQEKGISSFEKVQELLGVFQEEMKQHADYISQVTTTKEILENERAGKLSALLTIEGGEACEGSLDKLKFLYEQGARMMTLTWNYPNEIGFPNFKEGVDFFTPNMTDGLTKTGICIVEEMDYLGMIIDVSHLSDAGFYDVLNYTKQPFVASHSNAREVSPWVRNLTDDMIRKLAERGGVIGLNYCADFLRVQTPVEVMNEALNVENHKKRTVSDKMDAAAVSKVDNLDSKAIQGSKATEGGRATLEDIAKHAKHIANVGGMECLGLGSDFDGIPAYPGMPRVERIYELADVLEQYGFYQSEIDKIFYQNVFRLYRDVLG